LAEQRRIAAVLREWDRAIDLTESLIAAKLQRKKALLRTLFLNLPKRLLVEVAEVWFSGTDKKSVVGQASVRLCNYMDVFHNERITSKIDFMLATASPKEIAGNKLYRGDVVFTKDSETAEEIAEPALIAEDIENLVCGYHLAIARPIENMSYGPFLAQAMRHDATRWQFSRLANGVVRFGLTLDAIEQAEIFAPSLPVQEQIAQILDTADDGTESLQSTLQCLREQRRGLMQKLMTGQHRLRQNDAEHVNEIAG
jgi:type I restriction enzyme S subunit